MADEQDPRPYDSFDGEWLLNMVRQGRERKQPKPDIEIKPDGNGGYSVFWKLRESLTEENADQLKKQIEDAWEAP